MEKITVKVSKEHYNKIVEQTLIISGSDLKVEEIESLTFIADTDE